MRLVRLCLMLLAAATSLLAASELHAQQAQSDVGPAKAVLTPATATVGERLSLVVTVDHPGGVDVTAPGFGADFGGLDLVEVVPPSDAQLSPGNERTTFSYTLAAFKTGAFTIPPLTLSYTAAGASSGSIVTEPVDVSIESVLAPGERELRPLKPQLDLEDGAPPAVAPALFVAAFAALTAAGYVLYRRAALVDLRPAAEAPPIPPEVIARSALDAIAAGGSRDDVVGYYAAIARVVRAYLSARFGFPAYAMTRRELEREMPSRDLGRWPARLTANLLGECDAVQFAGFRPAPERRDADLTAAYEIVALTNEAEAERPRHA